MYVPIIRKMVDEDATLIERSLPAEGNLHVRVGESIRAFDHIGECTISHKSVVLPNTFNPSIKNINTSKKFAYSGSKIGSIGRKKITAPYNGFLQKNEDGSYIFEEEPHAYLLLSGVWGEVSKIVDKRSVLIQAKTRKLHLAAATSGSFVGELVVIPNKPNGIDNYFEKMVNQKSWGKVIYAGDYIDMESFQKIEQAGIKAILAGSSHREVITYAKQQGLYFGLVSGFGDVKTPSEIHTFLEAVGERLVFFQGLKQRLVIPISPEDDEILKKSRRKTASRRMLKSIRKGMRVVVYQGAYFGYIGEVESVRDISIMVNIDGVKDSVEVFIPNLFILE